MVVAMVVVIPLVFVRHRVVVLQVLTRASEVMWAAHRHCCARVTLAVGTNLFSRHELSKLWP